MTYTRRCGIGTMVDNSIDLSHVLSRGRLVPYLLKSVALVALLFALSKVLPVMPAWAIALALAVLSLVPAIGSIYRTVVNRTFNQGKYEAGSIHTDSFLSRALFFIAFYALSVLSVASIFMESPAWGVAMWVTIVLAVPIYIGMSLIADWFVRRKEKAILLVRDARAARGAVVMAGVVLCVVITVISAQPSAGYGCAADAFMAAPKPFEASPSLMMREVGELMALVDGLKSYAIVKLSESSWHVYLILQIAFNAAAMFGVTGMLSVCFIEPR